MIRLLRIYKKSISFSIAQATVFRAAFLLFFFWLLFDNIIKIAFFKAIFLQVPTIGGWSFIDCFMLIVFQGMMWDVAWTFYISAFEEFIYSFSEGMFDFVLTKPMHPLTYITITGFSAKSFSGSRFLLLLYAILFFPIAWHFGNILLVTLIFISGLIAMHAVFALFATIPFWTIQGAAAFELVYNITEGSRVPYSAFPKIMRAVFTFLIPIFLISSFPVLALKGEVSIWFGLLAIIIALTLELLTYKVWDYAIKNYSSASS